MRLLLTNDDSIESPFLHALISALHAAGHELVIAAPKTEQSWIGCAKSRLRPVTSFADDRGFGCPTWIIDGTPSDCVSIALAHLIPSTNPIDAVVSGINIGRNASLGFILASGTIAGAWEGALHGLPAIAFSQDLSPEQFETIRAAGNRPDITMSATLAVSATRAAQLVPSLVAATTPQHPIVVRSALPSPTRIFQATRSFDMLTAGFRASRPITEAAKASVPLAFYHFQPGTGPVWTQQDRRESSIQPSLPVFLSLMALRLQMIEARQEHSHLPPN